MISLLGSKNPEHLAALIEICFNPYADRTNYLLIDQGIQNDDLSPEQYRVLPLLYKSKIELFSEFTRLKIQSSYKHTLYRNHILLNRAQRFQGLILRSELGNCIFLKGVAQSLGSKGGIGIRPMADIDILIPNLDMKAEKFLKVVNAENYEVIGSSIRSVTLLCPEGFQLDIHWYLAEWAISSDVVNSIVSDSQEVTFRNQNYRILSVEHNLVHVIGHGLLNPNLALDARWVIDALSIINDFPNLDSSKMLKFSNLFNSRSRLKLGLQLIADETSKNITFNRELFLYVSKNIQPDNKFSSWLFNPLPGTARKISPNHASRSAYIKNMMLVYMNLPYLMWKKNSRSFIYTISLMHGFPPPPFSNVARMFARKLPSRFIFLLFKFQFNRH